VSAKTTQICKFLNLLRCTNLGCRFLQLTYQPRTGQLFIKNPRTVYLRVTSISISPAGIYVIMSKEFRSIIYIIFFAIWAELVNLKKSTFHSAKCLVLVD
jgi:hypothetical protein